MIPKEYNANIPTTLDCCKAKSCVECIHQVENSDWVDYKIDE